MPKTPLVALVTGGSRGAGRAIANVLGERKAKVYVTGRNATELAETARLVVARGGAAHPIVCDHRDDGQVERAFARIEQNDGRLDLLVNNVWGGYEAPDHPKGFVDPFWKQPDRWDSMFVAGLRAHLTASRLAVPLMLPRKRGLIVSTVAWAFGLYLGNLPYDTAKGAIVRMTFGMGKELRGYRTGLAAVAVAPGFMRTESVLANFHTDETRWKSVTALKGSESPEYLGRAIAALATASKNDLAEKNGTLLTAGALAREYDFTDIDGSRPKPFTIPKSETWYWKLYGS